MDSTRVDWLRRHVTLFVRLMRRPAVGRTLAVGLAVVAIVSGFLTYAVMTGRVPVIRATTPNVLGLLLFDLIVLLLLGAVIAYRVVLLIANQRRQLAGSRLHVRLVMLFSVVAVVPTIVIASFSVLFFHFGLQGWFSDRVRTALGESIAVAEAYLSEHRQTIIGDVLAMANDFNREGPLLLANLPRMQRFLEGQARVRGLTEAVVFDRDGRVLARAGLTFGLEFEPVPDWALDEARRGGVPILTSDDDDRLRALVKLEVFDDLFLYVGRFVERRVLNHLEQVRAAVSAYETLEGRRSQIEINFALLYAMVALLFLLAAVWFGFNFASQLAKPIGRLVGAAERIRSGDMGVRVPTPGTGDELDVLSRAFNRMTGQLEAQRDELVEANRQLDERRRFTEAVLAGVASGVIGLDAEGCLNLPNRTGSELLGIDLHAHVGQPLREIVPQMADALDESRRRPARLVESQVTITVQGRARTLLVRVTAEVAGGDLGGFVVTFTDITALLAAQRKAAWADIARRIAHEIKNPLTPIQLAAERLRRRYLPQITNDPETFQQCTDTIVRQVDDLRQMVDEFSSFARLPTPVMAPEDLADICRKAVFLQRQAHSEVAFAIDLPQHAVTVSCDRRQINQVLTNLLQNAADAIEAAKAAGSIDGDGWIGLQVRNDDGRAMVVVEDNGVGLPAALKDRLTEPYVTTRSKGTGLGLAIAKKIMEEHGGELVLEDREERGARVVIALPLLEEIAVGAPSVSDGEAPVEGTQSGKKAYGA